MPPTGIRRRDALRLAGLGAAVVAAGGVGLSACGNAAIPEKPIVEPEKGWGAFIPAVIPAAGTTTSPIEQLARLAGGAPNYLHRFASFQDSPPIGELDAIVAANATPLLTFEPWTPGAGIAQPLFALSRVATGVFDGDLRRWGAALATWGKPLLFRFAQEFNGTWYPWSIGFNGNTAADYIAAWRHVRSVMLDAGASNLRYVWAPNVVTLGTNPFLDAYPGADQVDVVGLDGYNWGDVPGHYWQPARDLFGPSLAALRGLDAAHPILITEVACAEGPTPQDKADWIRDLFGIVESDSRIKSFIWFQMDKERDWRFNTTPESTAAFQAVVSDLLAHNSPG